MNSPAGPVIKGFSKVGIAIAMLGLDYSLTLNTCAKAEQASIATLLKRVTSLRIKT